MKNKFKEFAISSWAIDNRTTIFLLTLVIVLLGYSSYRSLPKENFPEIFWPVMYVSVPYPGTAPADIEKLINKKIEDEVQNIDGVKKVTSAAVQDYGSVFVEFETGVDLSEAKRDVKDAVDRARGELPNDLPTEPQVMDIDFSEFPIMFLNLSGPFDNVALKDYSEAIQDRIEDMSEIRRVDIVGALEQEVHIDLDLYKMQAASISFGDVEQAVAGENVIISGGEMDVDQQKIAVRINGEFNEVNDIGDLLIKSGKGNTLYLKDIATVTDGFKDRESMARLNGDPVITMSVIKKSGENLIDAAAQIETIIDEMRAEEFPEDLTVTVAQDQSVMTKNTLNELTNTIIIGFILVTLVLMFFMGVRDALFVGLAVPLSSLIAFMVIPFFGFSLNLIVLFTFILAMGIVVDNAIVVIENTHRIFHEEGLPIKLAAKKAAGEVIAPVFSGTLTTVAPFTPLLFWPGAIGEFMGFMPMTMIITLFASLFVAYVMSPVFAVSFMKPKSEQKVSYKTLLIYSAVMAALGILFHLGESPLMGNFMFFMIAFVWLNGVILRPLIDRFQQKVIPFLKNGYRNILAWCLKPGRPGWVLAGSFLFFIVSFGFIGANFPKVITFPAQNPNFIMVYNEMPVGTTVEVTDSITRIIEKRVYEVIGDNNPNVKSVVTNIAVGAGDPNSFDQGGAKSNKGKVTVEFVEFKKRADGFSTLEVMEEVRQNIKGIPGTKVTVDKEAGGPPVGKPVDLLLTSENFEELVTTAKGLLAYLDSLNIGGVEELKWNQENERSELIVNIDRVKASQLGMSSGQIGMALRTGIFGKEISKFRPENTEDEYDIILRLGEDYRDDISALLNMNITFMDQSTGSFKSIPISSVADISYSSSYGSINRTDLKKSINLSSNVLDGYNAQEVNDEIAYWIDEFKNQGRFSDEVSVKAGGEIEDQAKEMAFLGMAFLISILFIFLILATQFNSLINVLIILSQVLLSTIGAILGIIMMGMDFSIIMNGVGIIALAGIVVNNGIILLDFIHIKRKDGLPLREAVVEGGSIRFTPVLLTASSTILGLVPLALSMNINFETLILSLDPQLFFGGDSAAFWGPLSWTIIWGLTFATLVTLIFVPVLYFAVHHSNEKVLKALGFSNPFPEFDDNNSDEIIHFDEEKKAALMEENHTGGSNGNVASDSTDVEVMSADEV